MSDEQTAHHQRLPAGTEQDEDGGEKAVAGGAAAPVSPDWRRLGWLLAAILLLLLILPLTLEIIRRFWSGAPDTWSFFGTLLTLLVALSPLSAEGRKTVAILWERVGHIQLDSRVQVVTAAELLILLILLLIYFSLPQFARVYNNQGLAAVRDGDLNAAERNFRRAVAMDHELGVPYYNLGNSYWDLGFLDEAEHWYRQALEQDGTFVAAYLALGNLYNSQDRHREAEWVLLAGLAQLQVPYESCGPEMTDVGSAPKEASARQHFFLCYSLLSELGRSYFGQERYVAAQGALDKAMQMGAGLEETERHAQLHSYQAQRYEQEGEYEAALAEWDRVISLADRTSWAQQELLRLAEERRERLEETLP